MTTSDEIKADGGVSRRTLIKGAVVAGGLAWTAPTVLAGPAWATHDTTTECFFLKIASNEGVSSPNYSSSCIFEHPNAPQDLQNNDVLDGRCLIRAGLIVFDYSPSGGFEGVTISGVAAEGLQFIGAKLARNADVDCTQPGECCLSAQGIGMPPQYPPQPWTEAELTVSTDLTVPSTTIAFDADSNVSYIELFICISFGSIPPACQ